MQNGCFCCTLQNDLVEQIISLAQKNMFNYMLIEASGVSEPAQIAPLFELCEDEHDHEQEHKEGPELGIYYFINKRTESKKGMSRKYVAQNY